MVLNAVAAILLRCTLRDLKTDALGAEVRFAGREVTVGLPDEVSLEMGHSSGGQFSSVNKVFKEGWLIIKDCLKMVLFLFSWIVQGKQPAHSVRTIGTMSSQHDEDIMTGERKVGW